MVRKTQHWIEPTFDIDRADDCAVFTVDAADGEWVAFVAAGRQRIPIFKDVNAFQLFGLFRFSPTFGEMAMITARKFFCSKQTWRDQRTEVELFCHGVFRNTDHDKILVIIGRSRPSKKLEDIIGKPAIKIADELHAKFLNEKDAAEAKKQAIEAQNEKLVAILKERGQSLPCTLDANVEPPKILVSKELIDALPVAVFANDVLNPASGLRSATRHIIASGYPPERSGSYSVLTSLRGVGAKKDLVNWQPWKGNPSYPEVRAALASMLPRAFEVPRWTDIGRPSFEAEARTGEQAQPDLALSSDIFDALEDIHLDDRDINDRVDGMRGALNERGFEALAWYQGHHFWSEETWGIYIDASRLDDFALSLRNDLRAQKCAVSAQQAAFLAIGLVLSHERFHARVEAASCWQELSTMRPVHRKYAQNVYQVMKGTEGWLEEALANWASWSWFQNEGLDALSSGDALDPKSWTAVVEGSLDLSPAGYRHWRHGHQRSTWRTFAAQLCRGIPSIQFPPLETILQGPFPFDLISEDIPIRIIGAGSIVSAILSHPATFNVPSRRELERALRQLGHILDVSGGKGGHQKWTAPDQRAFILPTRDPVSRKVFSSFLAHIGLDKSRYVRELRPSL